MARRKRNRTQSNGNRGKTEIEAIGSRSSKPTAGPGPMSYDTLEGVYSPSALSGSPVVSRNWERSALTASSRTNTWGLSAATFMFPNFYGGLRGGVEPSSATDIANNRYLNTGNRVVSALVRSPIFTNNADDLMAREVFDAIRTKTRTYRTYTLDDVKRYLRLAFWSYSMEIALRYFYYLSAVKFPGMLDLGGRLADALSRTYGLYGWQDRAQIESKMKSSQTFMATFFMPPKLKAYAEWLAASYWLYDNELSPVGMYYTYGTMQVPFFPNGFTGSTLYSAASTFTAGASLLEIAETVSPDENVPGPDTTGGNGWIKRLLITDLYHVYGEDSRMSLPEWEMCAPRIDPMWTALWRNGPSTATYTDGEVAGRVTVPPLAGVSDQFGGSTTVTETPDNPGTLPWFSQNPPSSLELISWGLSFPVLQTTENSFSNYYLDTVIERVINYSMAPYAIEKYTYVASSGEWVVDTTPPGIIALIDQNALGDLDVIGVQLHAIGNGITLDYEGDSSSTADAKQSIVANQAYYGSLLMASERIWATNWGSANLPTNAVVTGGAKVWQQGLAPLNQPRRAGHPYLVSNNAIRNASFEFAANMGRM